MNTYFKRGTVGVVEKPIFRAKTAIHLLLGLVTIGLCSCGEKPNPAKDTKESTETKPIKTAKAEMKPMERIVIVTGSFHPNEQATLSVKVPGRLEKIAVDIGSVVKKGDVLAQIEREDYQLHVKQAEAVLAQTQARLGIKNDTDKVDLEKTGIVQQAKALLDEATKNRDRTRELARQKISSQSELDTVEAAYTVAETNYRESIESMRERLALSTQRRAELNLAQKDFVDSIIYSPFDGIVQQRRASLGEFLQAGTPLLVIASVDPLRLRLEVPERASTKIMPGQPIRITVGESTNIYPAQISRVSPMLSESNRMLVVEADVPAVAGLKPGLFAQAEIIVSTNDPALCIPESAITTFVGMEKAFIVKEGKAVEKGLMTGRRKNGFVEVLSGIAAGDVVILNAEKIRSGQTVSKEADAKAH